MTDHCRITERQDFEGHCATCGRLFFPMRCAEHHILMPANQVLAARVSALENALRKIDNIVVRSENARDMYDDVRAAVARALGTSDGTGGTR